MGQKRRYTMLRETAELLIASTSSIASYERGCSFVSAEQSEGIRKSIG